MTQDQHEMFHKEDHGKLAELVISVVDYGSKISALQQTVAIQQEKLKEIEKDKSVNNQWKMKMVGWGLTVAMAIGGGALSTYSKVQAVEARMAEIGDDLDSHESDPTIHIAALNDFKQWVLDKFLSKEAYDREQKHK